MLFRCYCNTHGVRDIDNQAIEGIGLYHFGSKLNHSCVPNCTHYTRGNLLYVRTLRDIEPEEELTISYTELFASRATRHSKLYDKYAFSCGCRRCRDELRLDRGLCSYKCNTPCGPEGAKCTGTIPYFEPFAPEREAGVWGTCEVCGAAGPSTPNGAGGDETLAKVSRTPRTSCDNPDPTGATLAGGGVCCRDRRPVC